MKHFPTPFGTTRSDGDERVAKLRKENLRALREREDEERKATEGTRKLRLLRKAREEESRVK